MPNSIFSSTTEETKAPTTVPSIFSGAKASVLPVTATPAPTVASAVASIKTPSLLDKIEGGVKSFFSAPSPINPAVTNPRANSTAGIISNTVSGLPKAAWDFLGPGKVQDFLSTPEGKQAATDLSPSDFLAGGKKAAVDLIAAPVADIAGVAVGPKEFNVPGIGKVSNIQKQTKDAVESGENPFVSIIKAVPQSIFDGLMVAGLADKVFSPRESVIAKGVKINDLPSGSEIPGDKSFRLSNTDVSKSHPVPNEVLTSLQQEGVRLNGYNPENPTFFRVTPKANGVLKGEIVQIKPSYFDLFKSKFGGDISQTPSNFTDTIYEKDTTPGEIKGNLEGSTQTPTTPTKESLQSIAREVTSGQTPGEFKVTPTPADIQTVASDFKPAALTKYDMPEIVKTRNSIKNITQTSEINTPERDAIRKKAIDTVYGDGAKVKAKRMDIVTGGAGSRKSSLIAEPLAKEHGSLITDSDKMKQQFPEFGKGPESASMIHKESAIANKDLLLKAIKNGDNIVFPTVGRSQAALEKIIDIAHEAGYDIHLHHAELNPDIAIPGTIERFKSGEQGFIDPQDALEGHLLSNNVNGTVKTHEKLTSATKYSTDVKRGEKPTIIEHTSREGSPNESQRVDEGRGESLSTDTGGNDNSSRARGGDEINPNGLQTATASLRKGSKGTGPDSGVSSTGLEGISRGDVIQSSKRIAEYLGEDGEGAQLVVRQGQRLEKGDRVALNDNVYNILRTAGYSDALVDNLKAAREQGGVSSVILSKDLSGGDFVSAFKDNTIYLNPDEINHPSYQDGSIINHELAGHSWYQKLSDESRQSFFNDLKNSRDTVKSAWAGSDNPYKFYWSETLNEISSAISVNSTPEITDRIINDFGLKFDDLISLDHFIDQSLSIDKVISAVNTELGRIGRDPINLQAHNTIAAQEHVSMIAENHNTVDITEGPLENYVSDIENGKLKYGTEATKDLVYQGETDLTIKTLEKLKTRATVSKQFIQDLTNSPDLKQAEKNVVREVLAGYPDDAKIPVKQFAEDVKIELLPLTTQTRTADKQGGYRAGYESVTLPDNLRGNVANYYENIYESPIATSAGEVHFQERKFPNYFGHTRIEDMAGNNLKGNQINTENGAYARQESSGDTRRVIEVQSDLYQKGNLDRENNTAVYKSYGMRKVGEIEEEIKNLQERIKRVGYPDLLKNDDIEHINVLKKQIEENLVDNPRARARKAEIQKLQQYNDPTAHFRMVREEIRKTAQDGKTKLQFPTGETAMKIEGLGQRQTFRHVTHKNDTFYPGSFIEPSELKVGMDINDGNGNWIITDVLEDGKFSAIPESKFKDAMQAYGMTKDNLIAKIQSGTSPLMNNEETFDISGKTDINNPIYKFYEKDLGRYLKNQYSAKPVTDDKGVTWNQVDIKPEMAKQPVVAFRKGTTDIDQLNGMLDRAQKSLDAAKENPEAHRLAYGEDRIPVYEARIKELTERIAEATSSNISRDKVSDIKLALERAKNNIGTTPEERARIQKEARQNDFTVPEFDNEYHYELTDMIGAEDLLKIHPARPFLKYANKRTGLLPQIIKENPGVYGQTMTKLLLKHGFSSVADAQKALNNFYEHADNLSLITDEVMSPIEKESGQSLVGSPEYETELKRLEKGREGKPVEVMTDQSDDVPLKKKVGALDYLRTPNRVLEKIGLGDESVVIKQKYEDYLAELPKNIQKITDWSKELPKEVDGKPVTQRIFDYLNGSNVDTDGFIKPDYLTKDETRVANEIKAWLEQWADRLHIPQHQRLNNYITHIFSDDLVKKEFDQDLAKIIQDKVAGEVYDPFLEKRLGALGYKRDVWAALDAYVKRATRKVHMDMALEQIKVASQKLDLESFNYVKEYVDRVNLRPTKIDNLLDNTIKQMVGYRLGQRPTARISRAGRQMVYRGTLGLNIGSALKNLTQGANTFAKLGPKYTTIGYTKLLNPRNFAELEKEGILKSDIIQDRALSATKKFWEKFDKSLFYVFETAEKINRGSAYFGAKSKYYNENTRIDPSTKNRIYNAGASEKGAVDYARKMVEDTQFTFGSVDTPVALQSDIARTLGQFQSFNLKQAEFLSEMVKNKEYAGLIRYLLASLAFMVGIGKVFGMKWTDLIPFSRYSLPPLISVPLKLFNAATGAPDAFGNVPSKGTRIKNALSAVLPFIPAGIQGQKTYQGVNSIQQGEATTLQDKATAVAFGPKTLDTSPVSKQLDTNVKTAQTKLDAYDSDIKDKVQPVFDQAKDAGFGTPEADALVSDLSDNEFTVYNAMKAVDVAKDAVDLESKVLPIVQKASLLGFGTDQADQYIDDSFPDTDEGNKEYKVYQSIKSTLYGKDPVGSPTESGSEWDKQSFITHVANIAKSLGTDPVTFFNDVFAGNDSWKITGLKNGQIMVQRLDMKASEAIKKSEGGDTKDYKLDHIIPLEIGGNNGDNNLQLIPTDEWASNTETENYLGKALGKGSITGRQAREYIIRFKGGQKEKLSPTLQKEFTDKYKGQAITLDQIKSEVEK